jgi:hypothetical protein
VSSGARHLFHLTGTGFLIDEHEAGSVLDQLNNAPGEFSPLRPM